MSTLPSSSSIDALTASIHGLAIGGVGHPSMAPPSAAPQGPVRRGTVKFFKGFGFIVDQAPEQLGGQEVFCHFSAIAGKGGFRSLAEGEEVEYELVQGPKGFQAANLSGPNGRAVVGDPKARLAKPPTYMPFAPMSMPPYLSDPYQQQQHSGGYAASPYTQHVLYVPSTMHSSHSHSSPLGSQYSYSAPQGPSSLSSLPSGSGSTFNPGNYQQHSYAPASSNYPGAGASLSAGNGHGQSNLGGMGSSYTQNGGSYVYGSNLGAIGGRDGGRIGGGNLGGVAGAGGDGGGSYAFAPFNSPPSFNNLPLFATPSPSFGSNGGVSSTPRDASSYGLPQPINRHISSGTPQPNGLPSNGTPEHYANDANVSNGYLVNNASKAGIVGGPRTGTPREERREAERREERRGGTPVGLGNGSSGSIFAPVLFTTGDREYA